MEVDAVVEAALRQVDEVRGGDRHLVEEDFRLEGALGGLELGHGVGHGETSRRRGSRLWGEGRKSRATGLQELRPRNGLLRRKIGSTAGIEA